MFWTTLSEDSGIPEWLRGALPNKCPYCNKSMQAGTNEYGRYTGLKCEDDYCPSKIASQLEFVFNLLEVKGYGFATCLQLVRTNKWIRPIQYFSLFDNKPTMSLGVFLRCCCIQGIDGEWVAMSETADAYTLDELYQAYPSHTLLNENKELFEELVQYVNLKQRTIAKKRTTIPITIMITGTPIGYPTKEAFINACNEFLEGEFKVIHQETKRQSGVDFLIREKGSVTKGKVEAALKGHIPIVTSSDFMIILDKLKKGEDL